MATPALDVNSLPRYYHVTPTMSYISNPKISAISVSEMIPEKLILGHLSMYQHSPQNRNICHINILLTQTSGYGN